MQDPYDQCYLDSFSVRTSGARIRIFCRSLLACVLVVALLACTAEDSGVGPLSTQAPNLHKQSTTQGSTGKFVGPGLAPAVVLLLFGLGAAALRYRHVNAQPVPENVPLPTVKECSLPSSAECWHYINQPNDAPAKEFWICDNQACFKDSVGHGTCRGGAGDVSPVSCVCKLDSQSSTGLSWVCFPEAHLSKRQD